jgi:hypothetical protein
VGWFAGVRSAIRRLMNPRGQSGAGPATPTAHVGPNVAPQPQSSPATRPTQAVQPPPGVSSAAAPASDPGAFPAHVRPERFQREPRQAPGRGPRRRRDATYLPPAHTLGAGGQGTVRAVDGRPDLVIKTFNRPLEGAVREFQDLIDRGDRLRRALQGARVDVCWPEQVHGSTTRLEGYIMPKLGPGNYFDVPTRGKTRTQERTLDWAIWTPSAFQVPFTVSDIDRLEIVRAVARWLRAMHELDIAYGDLSFKNLCFTLGPEVRVTAFDFDSARVLGSRSFTRLDAAHSPDWHDPHAPDGSAASLDTDRYKFGLLAFRLLVSHQLDGELSPADVPPVLSGLTSSQVLRLKALWLRAAGPWGARPSLREWVDALAA